VINCETLTTLFFDNVEFLGGSKILPGVRDAIIILDDL